jgi:CRISPR-associated protein Cas2
MPKRLYPVAYDVADDTRRVKLANLLKSYGERVQLSVFECYLDEKLLQDLKARARRVLDLGQDALRLYPVQGEVEVLGTSPLGAEDPAFVVV